MQRELLQNLVNENKSVTDISKELNISKTAIYYWLRKYEIKITWLSNKSRSTWTKEQMINAISSSFTFSDVLRKIGLSIKGGNNSTVKKFVYDNKIDISHFLGKSHGSTKARNKKELKDVMVENSSYSRKNLKRQIIKNGILRNECYECGQNPEWKGKTLIMVLDHINGIPNDNRLENLRMLCPNCNSQQDTFSGRNIKQKIDAVSSVPERTEVCEAFRASSTLV